MKNKESDIMFFVPKDTRFKNLSVHDLKVMRANMINQGVWEGSYDAAVVQYWIMEKEGRLPEELKAVSV